MSKTTFLPFTRLAGLVFVWWLFLEGLKKLGLFKEAKSK